jgi:hypothetical protein
VALNAVPYEMAAGVGQVMMGVEGGQLDRLNVKDAEGFVMVGHPKLAPLFN